jgi:transposase
MSTTAAGPAGPAVDLSHEGAMLRYLKSWIDQLRWQRLKPMEKLADMLLRPLEGILDRCPTKVPLGVIEAVNGNIKALLRRGRGYRILTAPWYLKLYKTTRCGIINSIFQ